ncbi:glycoside hydrolase family 172 protein [Flavicella sp.]|uniref:glycoside hydrolase family 172 protein n=1 Tax=Flavicella sp. TaxID=2957742 RepID=UPI00301A01F3
MKNLIEKYLMCLLVVFMSISGYTQVTNTVTIESLLNEMINRDALASFPESNFRLKQGSSYNRASKSPSDSVGWFTNHDYNSSESDHNFIRTEETNGKKEWVLMEHIGAGAIVRVWTPFLSSDKPESDVTIRIYLDGNPEPVIEGNMLHLFDGTGLIPYPFAHKSLRSGVSFFPIPYAKGIKITSLKRPFFFQYTNQEYSSDVKVKSFSMDDFNAAKPLIEKIGKTLLNPLNSTEGKMISMNTKLKSGKEKSILLPSGVAAVRSLVFKLANYENPEVTRSVVLKMEFDGKQTVWSPIGDFFGTGIGLNPVKGWYQTVDEDGTMSCRWVMPYQKGGKITVVNLGEESVDVKLKVVIGDWKWDNRSMYFNAAWHGQYPVATRPFSDWNYVTIKGKGVYVGDALTVMNPVKKWWGEGDEKIWVDGEDFPSLFGTGTEDYYAYSWGGISTDFYEHPFHAQPRSYVYNKLNRKTTTERNTSGYSTETRTRSLDTMPFETSLQLDMEIWSVTDCNMGYGVGVYWYGFKETISNRKPDPEGVLIVPPLPDGFPNSSLK